MYSRYYVNSSDQIGTKMKIIKSGSQLWIFWCKLVQADNLFLV